MKNLMTIIGIMTSVCTAHAELFNGVGQMQGAGIKDYNCDISGKYRFAGNTVTKTISVFASDEDEARKICLNKIDAMVFADKTQDILAVFISKPSELMYVDQIEIRPGRLK